jgi:hypothetical protein
LTSPAFFAFEFVWNLEPRILDFDWVAGIPCRVFRGKSFATTQPAEIGRRQLFAAFRNDYAGGTAGS